MNIKQLNFTVDNIDTLLTEIMFEIASCRADGYEVVCLNLHFLCEDAPSTATKSKDAVTKGLKGMKQKGLIQFFASNKSFANGATEASFLINKYPELLNDIENHDCEDYFIVKL